jgi:putative colanic acid biosynthesis acetyltransferase WcaF
MSGTSPSGSGVSPYAFGEKVRRVLWGVVQATLFRGSFHTFYGWRRMLLRAFGARLAGSARVRRTVRVECPWNLAIGEDSSVGDFATLYCLGPVRIGKGVTISQGAHICAGSHDFRRRSMPLLRPPIEISDHAWICADAFVGPEVKVGEGAILGARAVAMRPLEPWTIYAGNPAKPVRERGPFVD